MMGMNYSNQRAREEKISKLKSINEVQALRGVFYSFFEVKDVQEKDNVNDKVLINMDAPDATMNPFFKYEDEDEAYFVGKGMDISSHMYAYSSNLSGMFEHLNKKREQDAEFGNMQSGYIDTENTGRGDGRDVDLDIIHEQPGDDSGNAEMCETEENLLVVNDEDFIKKPNTGLLRRSTIMTESDANFYAQDRSSEEDYEAED